MKATHKGKCPVCGYLGALMMDETLFRHWPGIGPEENGRPDGFCRGWGRKAEPGTVQPIGAD